MLSPAFSKLISCQTFVLPTHQHPSVLERRGTPFGNHCSKTDLEEGRPAQSWECHTLGDCHYGRHLNPKKWPDLRRLCTGLVLLHLFLPFLFHCLSCQTQSIPVPQPPASPQRPPPPSPAPGGPGSTGHTTRPIAQKAVGSGRPMILYIYKGLPLLQ